LFKKKGLFVAKTAAVSVQNNWSPHAQIQRIILAYEREFIFIRSSLNFCSDSYFDRSSSTSWGFAQSIFGFRTLQLLSICEAGVLHNSILTIIC